MLASQYHGSLPQVLIGVAFQDKSLSHLQLPLPLLVCITDETIFAIADMKVLLAQYKLVIQFVRGNLKEYKFLGKSAHLNGQVLFSKSYLPANRFPCLKFGQSYERGENEKTMRDGDSILFQKKSEENLTGRPSCILSL